MPWFIQLEWTMRGCQVGVLFSLLLLAPMMDEPSAVQLL
jgi:hypothetical protein